MVVARKPKLHVVPGSSAQSAGEAAERPSALAIDDSQLLTAARRGDPAAAGAFCLRLQPTVERTIARLIRQPHEDRADLAQLAMIELVRTIDRYRGDCPLDAWAGTVTAHVVYKYLRRRKLERRLFATVTSDGVGSVADLARVSGIGGGVVMRGLLDRVLGHLQQMDSKRAWAVVLHDVHGHDLKEIAEIMGSTVANAQTRLSRGRRELHARIAADPELAGALEGMDRHE